MGRLEYLIRKLIGIILLVPICFILLTMVSAIGVLVWAIISCAGPTVWNEVGRAITVALICLAGVYVAAGIGQLGLKMLTERR